MGGEVDARIAVLIDVNAGLHRIASSASKIRSARSLKPDPTPHRPRYYVPSHVLLDFMKAIALREAALLSADGFVGLVVNEDTEALVFAVSTMWQVSERGGGSVAFLSRPVRF